MGQQQKDKSRNGLEIEYTTSSYISAHFFFFLSFFFFLLKWLEVELYITKKVAEVVRNNGEHFQKAEEIEKGWEVNNGGLNRVKVKERKQEEEKCRVQQQQPSISFHLFIEQNRLHFHFFS